MSLSANFRKPCAGAPMLAALALLLACTGCRLDMHVQPRYNPYDPTDFFGDGQSARMPVAGTVPRGDLTLGPNELFYTGKVNSPAVGGLSVSRDQGHRAAWARAL